MMRLLRLVGALCALTFAATLVGLAVDPRVITGAPAWLKPAKFAISLSIYAFTLLWLLRQVRGHARLVSLAAGLTAVTTLLELGAISLQAARGTTSHFNFATALDEAIFSLMGVSIVLLWLAAALVAVVLIVQRAGDPVRAWALRLALIVALVGMAQGGLMLFPASSAAGQPAGVRGAHAVGVLDGGPGLPIVGWSTVGGDLRVGHFLGLHALQVIPALGWLVGRAGRRLPVGHRVWLVFVGSGLYLGSIGLLTWQALRAEPLIAPGPPTLAAGAGLLLAAAAAAAATVWHGRRLDGRVPSAGPAAAIAGAAR
jgi:hypothetical protein